MKKSIDILLALIVLMAATSCMSSYDIQGTSNISTLDGRKLYLKIFKDGDLKNIDSCDVVHGQFHFHGSIDTVRLANIFMENEQLMPIIVEGGDIAVKVDDAQMNVSGSPLNEKLFDFLKEYNKVNGELDDLVHRHDQAIMNGSDMAQVIAELQNDEARLTIQQDSLLTHFITDNFDNVLGPGVFFLITMGYPYPELTPWVEDIMSKATEVFKNDAYVRDFYDKAKKNQEIMNGIRDIPEEPVAVDQMPEAAAAPTPNQLAQPVQ